MKRTVVIGLLVAVSIMLALTANPTQLWAHNGGIQLSNKEFAGPYEVSLGTMPNPPTIGALHMTLTVVDRSTRTVVLDAETTVTASGPDGSLMKIGPLRATPDPMYPAFYELDTAVSWLGSWTFTVAVDANLGYGSADFAIEVKKGNPLSGIITALTLLAFASMFGILVRISLTKRSRSRKMIR